MATQIYEGFSLSHAAILNGTDGVEEPWGDIYGVREGSIEVDTDSYDNTGDDAVLSSWFWFNFATVSITAGYVPFPLIASLSGQTVTSSTGGEVDPGNASYDPETHSLALWNESSLNQPTRPMMIRVPSKDSDGNIRVMDFVLYKVQFEPFGFDGPTYKDGLLLNYSGKCLMSEKDEKGADLPFKADGVTIEKSIGRLINRPATVYVPPEIP